MFNKLKKNTSMDMDEIRELLSDLSRKRDKKRIFVWVLIVVSLLTTIIGVRWFLLKRNDEDFYDDEDYEEECSCDCNETTEDEDEKNNEDLENSMEIED